MSGHGFGERLSFCNAAADILEDFAELFLRGLLCEEFECLEEGYTVAEEV
jgi:hypothetical protein